MAENWHQVLAAECGSPSVTQLQYFDPYYTSTLCGQVLLDKNLVGHEGGNGVTDCSPSNVAGHQQLESASPACLTVNQIVSVQPTQHLVDYNSLELLVYPGCTE